MNDKKIVGNGSKATLPGGKKMDDYKKPPSYNSITNSNAMAGSENQNQSQKSDEKQKSKGEQVAQKASSEALKASLKAAFPYIPQFIINKLVDSDLGQAVIEKQLKGIKRKIILAIIAVVGTVMMWLFLILMVFSLVSGPVAWINDAVGSIGGFFKSFGNWFIGNGWCEDEESCQAKEEYKYYEKLDKAVSSYSGSCQVNEDLITATIFYGQMVSEEIEDDDGGSYFNYLDVKEGSGTPSASSQINKLIRVYLKGESIDLEADNVEDLEIAEGDTCSVSAAAYRRYLIDTYIEWAYPSVLETRTKEEVADEIMAMGNIGLINRAFSSSIYCPTISVEQSDGTIEPMDLETYVARVVTKENSWNENGNIENMKAQAIAARTYALNYTNNCKNIIPNSTNTQTLADNPSADGIRAAEETNSLVLLEDGKVFSTQYDALAIDYELTQEKNDDNYYLKQAKLPISKSWLDEKITENQYEYYKNHNHGNGMSQWGSRYLQHIGKNYEEILNTFYTMAEITKMGGLISGGNYSSNSSPAADINELKDRSNTIITTDNRSFNLYSSQTGLISQCSWFGRTRAIEIIYYSDMPDNIKNTAINSLMATSANGGEWYDKSDGTIFTKTTDYTQPMPGSMAVWTNSCHKYGHVAIVEQVYESNGEMVVLLSETWNKAAIHAANNWTNTFYQIKERTLDYMKSHTNGGCTSSFVGYVYLLG